MDYHYVCVHPFGKYVKGQMITDEEEAAKVLDDHEHRFVRIAVPAATATVILPEPAADETAPSKRAIPRQT
jgi:hypothetical protein